MRHLNIDIETYSEVDIAKVGVYRYVDDPSFEILLIAYSFDDDRELGLDEPSVFDLTDQFNYKDFVEEFEINNIKTNLPDAQARSQEWDGNIFGINEILSVSDSSNNQESSLYDLGYDFGMSGDLYSF